MPGTTNILVVGVGNLLLSDDGVGVHAVQELQREPWPGVTVVEVGTAILHGLPFVEEADRVLVIDAAKGGGAPGTIYRFEGRQPVQEAPVHSIHALGLQEAASLLLAGLRVPPITILGMEPASLEYGMSLSEPVAAALPRLVALARETVAKWVQLERAEPVEEPASV
jgi:hydrogenase maturation protease